MNANIRNLIRTFLLLVGALALASCESIIPSSRPPAQQPAPQQPDKAPPPTTEAPPVQQGLPQDRERHRIALLVPLSGRNAAVGQSIANATTLAQLDTEAQSIRITRYDTARGVQAAASQALADGNKLILGPLLGENVSTVANMARSHNVPVISFSNDVSVAGDNVYIMGFTPAQSIDRIVSYARSQGVENFSGIVPVGTYGRRASNALLDSVRKYGGNVVSLQSYDRSSRSLSDAVKKLDRDSASQAILIADNGDIAQRAAPMLRKSASGGALILGTELWNTDNDLSSTSALRGAFFASVSDGYYRQYVSKYRNQFGGDPFRLSTLGYDAVLLVLRIAQNWQPGTDFPVKRMLDSSGFVGLDGGFRFGRDHVAERLLEVKRINANGVSTVSSAPGSF